MIFKGQSKFRDKNITEHFKVGEIACKDGSSTYIINGDILEGLEKLRTLLKKPISITSGYRSPEYNKRLNGSATDSQHCLGNAVDIQVKGMTPTELYDFIKKKGMLGTTFKGCGVYNSFVHLDVRPKLINGVGRKYDFWDNRK